MKITLQEAMERYPLRVYFPMSGEYQLLVVHNSQEHQQFLLAKSEEGLELLLRSYWRMKKFLPEIREAWYVSMVAPPPGTREKYATSKYEWDFSMFQHSLVRTAAPFVKSGALDAPLRPCPKYKPEPGVFGDGVKPSAYEKQNHICCLNCRDTQYVFDGDIEDLFLRKADTFEKTRHVGFRPAVKVAGTPRALESQANDPDPKEAVYIATADHGPHSQGNVIEVLNPDYISTDGYPLFFFQGAKFPALPSWVKKMVKEYESQRKKTDTDFKKSVKDDHKNYNDAMLALLKEVFS